MLKQLFEELRVALSGGVREHLFLAHIDKRVVKLHPSAERQHEILSDPCFPELSDNFRITRIANIKRCYV